MKLKYFFYLQRSDRRALSILFIGICVVATIFLVGKRHLLSHPNSNISNTTAKQITDKSSLNGTPNTYYKEENGIAIHLQKFDPNTADSTLLLSLGLQPWQVKNIYRYRAKGGIYRQASDFAKLYGLTLKQYRTLEPYISISSDYQEAANFIHSDKPKRNDSTHFAHKLRANEQILLNVADTNELKKVPGIGSFFAREIVRYRSRLGGFYSEKQLNEIENFPSEALPYLQINPNDIQPLHINQLSLNQLKRHPYFNFYKARAIIDYRRIKGAIKSIDELQQLKEFSQQDIERLKPYIAF